jgi:hypothetical protein
MTASSNVISRRAMLAGAGATGLLAIGAVAATTHNGVDPISRRLKALLQTRQRPSSLATAEIEDWMAVAGSIFTAAGYRLRFAGVRALAERGERPEGLRHKPFIAVFDALGGHRLPGGLIYTISHPDYPSFDIFLDDAPAPHRPRRMTALFN